MISKTQIKHGKKIKTELEPIVNKEWIGMLEDFAREKTVVAKTLFNPD